MGKLTVFTARKVITMDPGWPEAIRSLTVPACKSSAH
jgi:hypothetical protein